MKNWIYSQEAPTPKSSDISFHNTLKFEISNRKKLRSPGGHFFCFEYQMERCEKTIELVKLRLQSLLY